MGEERRADCRRDHTFVILVFISKMGHHVVIQHYFLIATSVLHLAKGATNWAGDEDIVVGLSRKTAPYDHGQTQRLSQSLHRQHTTAMGRCVHVSQKELLSTGCSGEGSLRKGG